MLIFEFFVETVIDDLMNRKLISKNLSVFTVTSDQLMSLQKVFTFSFKSFC